jgi:hypothetical protein
MLFRHEGNKYIILLAYLPTYLPACPLGCPPVHVVKDICTICVLWFVKYKEDGATGLTIPLEANVR